MLYLWIMVGSALGGAARYWFSGAVSNRIGETFPWGTMLVNISGSFVIGLFATLTGPDGRLLVGTTARQFVMIGLCGGYTTFSSFSLQTFALAQDGEWLLAGVNAGLSLVLCILAVWLGHILALLLNELNLASVFGLLLTPLGWGWALFVSGCAFLWLRLNGRVKVPAYRFFAFSRGKKPSSLLHQGVGPAVIPFNGADSGKTSQAPLKAVTPVAINWQMLAGALLVFILAWRGWTLYGSGHVLLGKAGQISRERTVSVTGIVSAPNTVPIETHVPGVILAVDCDVNTKVKAGQLCAKIDPRSYVAAVEQEKTKLVKAKSRLEKDNAAFLRAQAIFERDRNLANRRFISKGTLDKSDNAYEKALARAKSDGASVTEQQAALNAAETSLAYTDIVSPLDGTVVSRSVETGQTVTPNPEAPLFLVAADLSLMHVEANLSEREINEVKRGDKAIFTVSALPNHIFKGEVTEISKWPKATGNIKTYGVIIGASNTDLLLQPGMAASVTIMIPRRDNAMLAPGGVGHS